MRTEVSEILQREGILVRRQHPSLARHLDHCLARGQLRAVLPGIYAHPDAADTPAMRMLAVCASDPDAVIVDDHAARLNGWRDGAAPPCLTVATRRLRPRPWLRVTRRHIPIDRIRRQGGLAFTDPAQTAVDLAVATEGASLDRALRTRVHLPELRAAAGELPARRGIRRLRRLIHESRDRPWSFAERRAHAALRSAHILGWVGNDALLDAAGSLLGYGDLTFRGHRLVIEVDGDAFHLASSEVRRDRQRDRTLAEHGWTVVRVPAHEVLDQPAAFIESVRALLSAHPKRRPRRRAVTRRT